MKKIFMTSIVAASMLSFSTGTNASGLTDYALAKSINSQTEAQLKVENNRNIEHIRIERSNQLVEEKWHDRSNLIDRTDTYMLDGKLGQTQYLLNAGKRKVTIKYPSQTVIRTIGSATTVDESMAKTYLTSLKKSYVEELVAQFSWKDTGEIFVLPDGKKSKKKLATKKLANGTQTSILYVDLATNYPLKQEVTSDTYNKGVHKVTHETRTFERLSTVSISLFTLPLSISLKEGK